MSLNRRSFLSMTAIATALAAAAACSSDDTSTAASDAPVDATDESTDEQVVRDANADLVIWTDEVKAGALKDVAQEWGDKQGITVAVQVVADDLQGNFIAANQAGNGPDVVVAAHDWIGNLVQNGTISPITLDSAAEANYSQVALDAVTYDGQYYGVPYCVETLGLFVNTDLTDVTEPATIEELVAAGQASGADVVLSLPVGESGDAYHMEPLYTSGGGYLFGKKEDGSLDPTDVGVGSEGSIAAAEKIGELGTQQVLKTSITGDNAISLFTEGKAAYLISGPWALGDINTAGINFELSKIPGFEGMDDARPFAGVNAFYVAGGGANKAFAETFVADVAKDSSIAEAMYAINPLPPVHQDLAGKLESSDANMVKFMDFASGADPMPAIPEMSAIWGPLGMAEANIVGGADPESTMTSAGDEIRSTLGL
ncbi:sugar ABC transporter substrate-binding protein [Actinomyces ruminicola]|uniref:Arabinogalactan oligomer / maltooligosaccharide transport system substrate-binding protein n=1 Tax=Actinomyces ruminicola TaxID=332524 RepID=A0A1G9VVN7_9ACTO|nr:extracellular solute-binding protein [Actinomyces ruminicola]SDM76046.1 arabinogalactan oligomer / maltooligosaccharide transport system substrate-binding protein [Actinomyces ruminicola]